MILLLGPEGGQVYPTKLVMSSIMGADEQDYKLLYEFEMDKVSLTTSQNSDWRYSPFGIVVAMIPLSF